MPSKEHDSNGNPGQPSGEASSAEAAKSDKSGGFRCFYCNEFYSSDQERVVHIEYSHPGKIYYQTPEDFENRLKPN